MSQLQKLFEPIKVGEMELKNRIVMPAMAVGLGANDMVTDRFKDFYAERACGGVAVVVIGLAPPIYPGPILPGSIGIYEDEFIAGNFSCCCFNGYYYIFTIRNRAIKVIISSNYNIIICVIIRDGVGKVAMGGCCYWS